MPYINLIQEQRNAEQRNDMRARLGFFAFAGIATVSILTYFYLLVEAGDISSQQEQLEARLVAIQPTVEAIKKNSIIESELKPKVDSLQEASKLTNKWIDIMNRLTTQTPNNTWLTAIRGNSQDPQAPITLSVSGMSTAQELIGDFISRAQNDPDLENVELRFTNEKQIDPLTKGIEFEISAAIADTATAPATVEEKK